MSMIEVWSEAMQRLWDEMPEAEKDEWRALIHPLLPNPTDDAPVL